MGTDEEREFWEGPPGCKELEHGSLAGRAAEEPAACETPRKGKKPPFHLEGVDFKGEGQSCCLLSASVSPELRARRGYGCSKWGRAG